MQKCSQSWVMLYKIAANMEDLKQKCSQSWRILYGSVANPGRLPPVPQGSSDEEEG